VYNLYQRFHQFW